MQLKGSHKLFRKSDQLFGFLQELGINKTYISSAAEADIFDKLEKFAKPISQ